MNTAIGTVLGDLVEPILDKGGLDVVLGALLLFLFGWWAFGRIMGGRD